MRAGNFSRIVRAIGEAENRTSAEIRVHLSKRWIEPNPLARAQKLFHRFEMHQTAGRNGVLLYVNLRRKKFAIYGDEGIHFSVGQTYWERIARQLTQDLRSTHYENAIALAVGRIGDALAEHFPEDPNRPSPNELSDEVSFE